MTGHTHDHPHSHGAADHGHTHEILTGPGSFLAREPPIVEGRNWADRAFTVGIGGFVIYFPFPSIGSISNYQRETDQSDPEKQR